MQILAHLPALRRYAFVLTRTQDAADDLVQETLVRALERADTWRPGADGRAWLLAILHNTFVSSWRHQEVGRLALAESAPLQRVHAAAVQTDQIQFGQVIDALLALPIDLRQPLALVALEGMSYQEAATLLAIPIGTLMSRISRARTELRHATGETGETGSNAPQRTLKVVR